MQKYLALYIVKWLSYLRLSGQIELLFDTNLMHIIIMHMHYYNGVHISDWHYIHVSDFLI